MIKSNRMLLRTLSFISLACIGSFGQAAETKLTILHVNDHHSHLSESSAGDVDIFDSNIPASISVKHGNTTYVRAYFGGYPRTVTAFQDLELEAVGNGRDVLKLHAGDAITGTTYFTLFEGDADAKLMTHVCFDAFSPGNHEFDNGDAGLAKFLVALKDETDASSTCNKMPDILGANIVPHENSPLLEEDVPVIQGTSIYEMNNGEFVGVIGIDVKDKTMKASLPDPGTIFLDEIETTKEQVKELEAAGVNKIILLTHIGYDKDQDWIASIPGVDVVVGGDSHSLLGNEETEMFGSTRGSYATVIEKTDGTKVCVVQAWEYSKLIGNLEVDFDEDGNVLSCGGNPVFPLNPEKVTVRDIRPRYDMPAEDAAVVIAAFVEATGGQARAFKEDADTANDLAVYEAMVDILKQTVIAQSSDFISLEDGAFESGACDLVAQGFLLNPLSAADVSIQNTGGCRASIEKGNFTIEDAYKLLPFSNTMIDLIMTGEQIHNVLEDAVEYYLDPSGSWGAYPRTAGLRFDVDEAQEKGSRVSNLEVNVKLAGSWGAIDMSKSYTVVTNDFIATPRDGYFEFGNIADDLKVNTYVEYAQSFVDYAKTVGTLEPVGEDRASTQVWSDASPVESPSSLSDESDASTEESPVESTEEDIVVSSEESSSAGLIGPSMFLLCLMYVPSQFLFRN